MTQSIIDDGDEGCKTDNPLKPKNWNCKKRFWKQTKGGDEVHYIQPSFGTG
jgi:hypothetical protein